jgi:hypothetical protein
VGQTQTPQEITRLGQEALLPNPAQSSLDVCGKTEKRTPDGKPVWLRLVYAGETKIRRHVKIRADANPFDPQWQDYFAERAFQKKFGITRQQPGLNRREAGSAHAGLCSGLSRMRGNSHVRF